MYDSNSKNSSSRSHRPDSARTVPAAASGMTPSDAPVEGEHLELRRDVVKALHDDAPADERECLDRVRSGGHDGPPVRRCRVRGIDLDDPSGRRVPVGLRDQAVAGERGDDVRVEIAHDGPNRRGRRRRVEILEEDFRAGPPVRHAEQEVLAVLGDRRADPVAGTEALAEDLTILCDRCRHRMVTDADARRPILPRVVEAAAVWSYRDAAIQGSRQPIRQIVAGADSTRAQFGLVLAAGTHAVDE